MTENGTARHLITPDIAAAGRLTVYGLFRSAVARDPQAIATVEGGRSTTYAMLDARVRRLASALHDRGIRRGDRIAVLSQNRTEYIEIELAAALIGAIVACQNWRLTAPELKACLDLVEPALTFVSQRFAPLLASAGRKTPTVTIEEGYEELLACGSERPLAVEVDPEDGLVILYTSGTTGLPKGALISHRAEIARMALLRLDLRVTETEGFVAWAPMFHMASNDQMMGTLMSGGTVFVVDGLDAQRIVDIAANNRIGWLLMMPGSIEPFVELWRNGAPRPLGITVIGAMADLVPRALIAEATRYCGAPYLNSFGSTETGLAPASAALLDPGVVPESLSKLKSALCDVRLLDLDGNEVADGEAGDCAVRGPSVFSGYWNAPETNARDFAGGWFRLGDLFRRNPDGSYDFVDRAKYLIKSGGENIYPAEIEGVLLADARVTEAVVVRRADDRWGEVPVAFVARSDPSLDEAAIEALCRGALAGYKRPKEVRFIEFAAFPRSTTGKVQRHEMEARLRDAGHPSRD
ncbi:MAG: class I adenylate-forming enzyme family protein [Rhizobiaceae bacterium]